MLSHSPFYWSHLRRYVVLMGTLLNDISIVREGKDGKTKTIKVPVSFSQKDKALNRLLTDPELRNTWKNYLPRIGFEMGSPVYSPDRKDNTNTFYALDDEGKKRQLQLPPTPYDIPFSVYIWSAYYEDGLQIVEQILPFFQPDYFVKAEEVKPIGLQRDVSVNLIGVTQNDSPFGEFTQERVIEWQLDFEIQGFFYGPIMERDGVIKKTELNYFMPDFDRDPFSTQTAEVVPKEADRTDPHIIVEKQVNNYE